jgi:hypothetical protein
MTRNTRIPIPNLKVSRSNAHIPMSMNVHRAPRTKHHSICFLARLRMGFIPNSLNNSSSFSALKYRSSISSSRSTCPGNDCGSLALIRACVDMSEKMIRQNTAEVVAPRLKMMLPYVNHRSTCELIAGVLVLSVPMICNRLPWRPVNRAVCVCSETYPHLVGEERTITAIAVMALVHPATTSLIIGGSSSANNLFNCKAMI